MRDAEIKNLKEKLASEQRRHAAVGAEHGRLQEGDMKKLRDEVEEWRNVWETSKGRISETEAQLEESEDELARARAECDALRAQLKQMHDLRKQSDAAHAAE